MAASLILRTVKGTPLTNLEVDNNFSNLNTFGDVVSSNIGVLSALTTTAKSNIVFAVNEIKGGNLSQFAATTSAQLASIISDETGTGSLVFGTGPTITLANASGLPLASGITGLGSNQTTLLNTAAQTGVTPATYGNATNIPTITVDVYGRATSAANISLVTGVTPATYGNAINIPTFTVDSTGRITSASNVALVVSSSAVGSDVFNAIYLGAL